MTARRIAAAAIALLAVGTSHAQVRGPAEPTQPKWYLGAGIGYSKIPTVISSDSLMVPGATSSSFVSDRTDTSAHFLVGHQFTPYFALEGGYLNLGKFGGHRDVFAPFSGTYDVRWKVHGFNVDERVILPVSQSFSVYGKLGVIRATTKVDINNLGVASSESGHRWAVKYGVGAQLDVSRSFAVRFDADAVKKGTNRNVVSIGGDDIDYNIISGSAIVKF